MKTARFKDVVKSGGAPAPYLLWGEPEKDHALQSALKSHRILSVHQVMHGGKKDFAEVGLTSDRRAQLLLFPKSIRRFRVSRIIGIDYDLLAKGTTGKSAGRPVASDNKPVSTPMKPKPNHTAPPSANIVRFPSPVRTKKKISAPRASQEKSAPIPVWARREIAKTLRELKAGKAVAAYERLRALANPS